MFITNHAVIGALIGTLLPHHPILAFFVAFLFHFFSDMIPHGDTGLYDGYVNGTGVLKAEAFLTIDAIVAIIAVAYLLVWSKAIPGSTMFFGVVGSILPDALVAIYELTKTPLLKLFHRFHFFMHNLISKKTGDLSITAGFFLESVVFILVLYRLLII